MTTKQVEALLSCIKSNAINTADLYTYLNTINPGDFHFTNGTHFPVLIPGLTADGVFADDEYYLSMYERSRGKTTINRAQNYCHNRGTVLPSSWARDNMEKYRSKINESLRAINFPELQEGEYWAEGDMAGYGTMPEISIDGPGVGDWNYYGGSGDNYYKYVRGCVKVYTSPKQVNFVPEIEFAGKACVSDFVFKQMGVSRYLFEKYLKTKSSYPCPGNYLLKNGYCSRQTVYNQEAGIFVNPNLAIKLEMPKRAFTAEQAEVYLKANEQRLPEYFALRQVEKVVPQVNKSLEAIGMKDYALPEDVVNGFWCVENFAKAVDNADNGEEPEKKRLLFINHQNNVDDRFLLVEDIWEHISLE